MGRQFSRCARRRAFTLVEMLIAMVLTLILVTAIAQFYAIVGDSVKDGRAMIEMGSQMRAATQRLKADFDLITVSVVPWTDDGSASGYFEYFEGRGNDYDANGDGTPDSSALVAAGLTNLIGDGDDFIAFTIRSNGQPFTGRYSTIDTSTTPPTIQAVINTSQLAEVIWWVGFDDLDLTGTGPSGNWDFVEPRQIYRRLLLIAPETIQTPTGPISSQLIDGTATYPSLQVAHQRLRQLLQQHDVSMSVRVVNFDGSGNPIYAIRPNSLADLCKREYRFGHMPMQVLRALGPPPYLIDQTFPHSAVTSAAISPLLMPSLSAKSPRVIAGTQESNVLSTINPGEDIVLSNVLAFDVQLYDPYARIWPDSGSTAALVPSDPGYSAAAAAGTPATLLGVGAYVDLYYHQYLTANARYNDAVLASTGPGGANITFPYFAIPFSDRVVQSIAIGNLAFYQNIANGSSPPSTPLAQLNIVPVAGVVVYHNILGSTYDTWALGYERDGIDQFGDNVFDRQTNGLDDSPFVNGVDDASERETVPPYSQPLRGLQVKIRLYEPSTRQVRQATVGTDFITE